MGPLIDTGFNQALESGMGMGLHAAQLQNSMLYRQAALENQLARTSLYAQGLEQRAANAENHNRFLYDRLNSQNSATFGYTDPDTGEFVPGRVQNQNARTGGMLDNWRDQARHRGVSETQRAGLIDLREKAEDFKQGQANRKQTALDNSSLYQFKQMHPPLSDDQQGPPEDTSDPMAQWQSMDPQTRAREYHHWQGQQDKQAVIDHEHERAEKTIQGITADQGMSPDQKHAAIQTIRAKAAKLGLPSWIFRPKSTTQRQSSAETAVQTATDSDLNGIINARPFEVPELLRLQAKNEKQRRLTPPAPQPQPSAAPAGVAPPSPAGGPSPVAAAPVVAPAPAAPPQIDPGLIDQIEKDLPGASDEQIAAEYRRRTGGH